MNLILYDGTFEGFLSVVFYVYDQKYIPQRIVPELQYIEILFAEVTHIPTNSQHATRVAKGLKDKVGVEALTAIYKTFLSEGDNIELVLLHYVQLILKDPLQVTNYTQSCVLKIQQTIKQIDREVHRMHAFVRFQLTKDELYFAVIEPDFNVIPLIGSHFEKRYADQQWAIYDTKRNAGIHYDLETVQYFSFEASHIIDSKLPSHVLSTEEGTYQALWKDYFDAVNISERKNLKLHFRHVPKRYWKNLPEKYL